MIRFIEDLYTVQSSGKDGSDYLAGEVTVRPFDGSVTIRLNRGKADVPMEVRIKDMMEPAVLSPEEAATVAAGLRIIRDTLQRLHRQRGLSVVQAKGERT